MVRERRGLLHIKGKLADSLFAIVHRLAPDALLPLRRRLAERLQPVKIRPFPKRRIDSPRRMFGSFGPG